MAGPMGMAAQMATSAARVGWYLGINALVARRMRHAGPRPLPVPTRPTPSRNELLRDLGQLMVADARAVRDGQHAGDERRVGSLVGHIARIREMVADVPDMVARRNAGEFQTVSGRANGEDVPEYFAQDFHFQNGGNLSDDSARLYDVQVDTLFYGSASLMRRAAFPAIGTHVRGRDQRRIALLDVACGTGRFLRDVRLSYPAMQLKGLDLSQSYLDEARRHLRGLRGVDWVRANAERMPLDAASQDIVTCIYLFHELPPTVRATVAREIARVLKPGGLFVFIDSLQMGDKPGWDGLLEAFPERFHEPYYRHYAIDDLEALFREAGFAHSETQLAFLSKVMVLKKGES